MLLAAAMLVGTTVHGEPVRHSDPKRANPNYDGRGNTDSNRDHWLLWVPRIALAPVYALNEYVLRRPFAALTTTAERRGWASSFGQVFSFGKKERHTFAPIALFDLGVKPSIGAFYGANDVFADGNSISIHSATWGPKYVDATATDRYAVTPATALGVRVDFKRHADLLYFGTGPDTTTATLSRYGIQRVDAGATFVTALPGESRFGLFAGVRTVAFHPGDCCDDPSLDSRIADGTLAMPDGYNTPYTTLYQRGELALDTRDERPVTALGGYLKLHAETSFDVRNDRSWIAYGATFGVALDLHGRQHAVIAQVVVDYADPLHGNSVPFVEQPSLGGVDMPGFVAGWMTGRSALATQLAYSWPVWPMLVAQMRVSVGNAFGDRFDGLAAEKLRLSTDFSVTAAGKRDQGFEILVGAGSRTFDRGAGIESVRVSIGSRRTF